MRKTAFVIGLILCASSPAVAQRPMFIVNGVRIEKCDAATGIDPLHLSEVDPSVIDKVEVLKGAAAAKEYGPGATDGVIMITTKKGATISPAACRALSGPDADPFAKYLYTPELVMSHQEAIALTDKQRSGIQDAVRELQSKPLVDTQFKLALAGEKIRNALARATVDEAAVLQQIDEMLALEREVKRAQMTLLVRIKNQLTPEQRAQLDKLK
jgi:TonB-dependent SusC/RagA subfamily outer membrane receptor